LHRLTVLTLYRDEVHLLRRELSLSSRLMATPKRLQKSLAAHERRLPLDQATVQQFQHEPFRLKLTYMLASLSRELVAAGGDIAGNHATGALHRHRVFARSRNDQKRLAGSRRPGVCG
jgi:phosphoenolpyruvate carboxylase